MKLLYILFIVFILSILIAVHELGHFIVAKVFKVRVNEYSVGIGPSIWQYKSKETLYSLRAFPLGGYCALEGETDGDNINDDRTFRNQLLWKKILILMAGCFMNAVIAVIIIFCLYIGAYGFAYDKLDTVNVLYYDINSGEQLKESNIDLGDMSGSRIYKVNGHRDYTRGGAELIKEFTRMFSPSGDDTISSVEIMLPTGEIQKFEAPIEKGNIKCSLQLGLSTYAVKYSLINHFKYVLDMIHSFLQNTILSIQSLFAKRDNIKQMSSIVGVVDMVSDLAIEESKDESKGIKYAIADILYIMALISINLSVMNMLPIPVLDGGQIVLSIFDALCLLLSKKRIPDNVYSGSIFITYMLLIYFAVYVMINDIVRIFNKG